MIQLNGTGYGYGFGGGGTIERLAPQLGIEEAEVEHLLKEVYI